MMSHGLQNCKEMELKHRDISECHDISEGCGCIAGDRGPV